jgi:DNA invertase Pin-like site-specific DNA recombinase
MRIVTYARVSTKSQSDRGTSLNDQEKRFTGWLERSGHKRVRAYAEAMSGGKNMQERTFQGMLEDLPHLGAEALVVDSLDRFTRDKIAGAAMTHQLREIGVKLWELEYSDEHPFDLTVDEHRDYIVQRFSDAEAERRRIKKRQQKRYKEQRERNMTTTNRPAFGLRLAGDRKGYKWLEPDPDTAAIVNEVDRRIIAGQSHNKVLEWLKPIPGAWRSRRGLTIALNDKHGGYVAAQVRTPEVQRQLRDLLGSKKQSYGDDRSTKSHRTHPLSGLVACRLCVDAGVPIERSRMHGRYIVANAKNNPYALVCDNSKVHKGLWVSQEKVVPLIVDKLRWLRDENVARAVFEKWSKEPKSDSVAKLRRSLERQIAEYEEKEAELEKRIATALDLIAAGGPSAVAGKRFIENAEQERMTMEASKAALTLKLADVPVARAMAFDWRELQAEADRLFQPIAMQSENVEAWINKRGVLEFSGMSGATIRDPFAKWVRAIGPPQLSRKGNGKYELFWPFLDTLPNKVLQRRAYDQDADPSDWPDEHGPWDELPPVRFPLNPV